MSFRPYLSRLCLAAILMAAAVAARAGSPAWAIDGLQSAAEGKVAHVQPTDQGDIVVLAGGQGQGFRPGMSCQVLRNSSKVADLVIVRVREDRCAALILSSDKALQTGDLVKIKTL